MRSTLLCLLLVLAAALLGAEPAAAVETGINQTVRQTRPTAETAARLGAGWVRIWGGWDAVEPGQDQYAENIINDMNYEVNTAKSRGLKVLMVMQRTPAWASGGKGTFAPPNNPADFGEMMGTVARRIPGVDAWELWNEPDESEFFYGGPQPAKYAAMVKAAYPRIKAAQPNDVVVTGGLVGNDMDFVEKLYGYGLHGNFDALAVHTDTACLTDSPDYIYRDPQGRIGRYTFSSFREVHSVMARHGDGDKPIWMTELGWSTQSTAPHSCPIGEKKGTKPLGVSEARQAELLTQAFSCLQADPLVKVAFWFGMQDFRGSPHAGGYGLYRLDGSAKPSAAAFARLAKGIPAKPCGGVTDTAGPDITITKPTDGAKFTKVLPIDARAVDSSAGVGVRRIEIWADGKLERVFGDGHALMRSFWPVSDWRYGKHTLTFKAEDEAHNRSERSITVTKVRPRRGKARTKAAVAVEQLGPATVRVRGGVSASKKARVASRPRGRAFLVFQRLLPDGVTWETTEKVAGRAGRRFDVTRALGPGTWRVLVRYPGHKRYKKSRSKPVVFTVAADPAVPAPPA
jgi:hypothetical protein